MRGGKTIMMLTIGVVVMCLAITGCFFRKKKPDSNNIIGTGQPENGNVTVTEAPVNTAAPAADTDLGRLAGVRYEASGGSMNYHSEFEIDVNENEVVSAFYYEDFYFDEKEYELGEKKLQQLDSPGRVNTENKSWDKNRVEREHFTYDPELWKVLSEEFEYLKPQLTEMQETTKEDILRAESEMQVLDGGDYFLLHLTWEKDGQISTSQYRIPNGKRWSTIVDTLYEIVRPIGRDLRRVGETHITDVYLKTKDYSYQISPIKDSNKYYFFVHGGDRSLKDKLSASEWEKVRDYFEKMDMSGFEEGKYEDDWYLKINYNDGIYKYYKLDKNTASAIRDYFIDSGYAK